MPADKHSLVKEDSNARLIFFRLIFLSNEPVSLKRTAMPIAPDDYFQKSPCWGRGQGQREHLRAALPMAPPKSHHKKRKPWTAGCLYRRSHLRIDPWVQANNIPAMWFKAVRVQTLELCNLHPNSNFNTKDWSSLSLTFLIGKMRLIPTTQSVFVQSCFFNQEPQTVWLINIRNLLLTVLEVGSPRSRSSSEKSPHLGCKLVSSHG